MNLEVALYQPQIPQNTGNIGRLCVGYNVKLNLISLPSSASKLRPDAGVVGVCAFPNNMAKNRIENDRITFFIIFVCKIYSIIIFLIPVPFSV